MLCLTNDLERLRLVEAAGSYQTRPAGSETEVESGAVPGLEVLHPEGAPEREVARIVDDLNRLFAFGGIRAALAIGTYLIDTCFGGDPSRIHDRKRHPYSFRHLAECDDLLPSSSYLYIAVAVTEQLPHIPQEVRPELSLAHHRKLLLVRDLGLKRDLALRAFKATWSLRELTAVVDRHEGEQPRRAGRRKLPSFVIAANRLEEAAVLLANSSNWDSEIRDYLYVNSSAVIDRGLAALGRVSLALEQLHHLITSDGPE